MTVETKTMGIIEVNDDNAVTIPEGLFGFEDYTDYVLVESPTKPFIWLQSRQESKLAFLTIDPFIICEDYEADIDDAQMAKIGITEPSDVVVMSIITVPGNGGPVTANLQGPLIINKRNRQCMQVVLDGTKYTTKHDILAALKKKGGN